MARWLGTRGRAAAPYGLALIAVLLIPALLNVVQERGAKLASLITRQASLEDVFVSLTGRHLTEQETNGEAMAK